VGRGSGKKERGRRELSSPPLVLLLAEVRGESFLSLSYPSADQLVHALLYPPLRAWGKRQQRCGRR
jgi:hypothetical protein